MVDDSLNMSVQHVGPAAGRPAIRRAKDEGRPRRDDGRRSAEFAELAFAEEPPTEEEEHAGSALLLHLAESFVGFVEPPAACSPAARDARGAARAWRVDCRRQGVPRVQLAIAGAQEAHLPRAVDRHRRLRRSRAGHASTRTACPATASASRCSRATWVATARRAARGVASAACRCSGAARGGAAGASAGAGPARARSRADPRPGGLPGDQSSEGGSSADEAGMRILPMLERMPVGGARGWHRPRGADARGGTPMPDDGEEAWL